jgi:hypothetical protein
VSIGAGHTLKRNRDVANITEHGPKPYLFVLSQNASHLETYGSFRTCSYSTPSPPPPPPRLLFTPFFFLQQLKQHSCIAKIKVIKKKTSRLFF